MMMRCSTAKGRGDGWGWDGAGGLKVEAVMNPATGMKRAEIKRRAIISTARRLFLNDGFDGTRMEVLAKEARVSTATIYSYFPNKDHVLLAIIREALDELIQDYVVAEHIDGDVRTRLNTVTLAYARLLSDPTARALYRIFAAERLASERRRPSGAAELFERWMAIEQRGALLGLLQKLAAEGALEVEDLDTATSQLLSMIEHPILTAAMDWSDGGVARPLEDVCEAAVDTFLARYGAPEQRAASFIWLIS